jgi:hypothetical protein
MRLNALTLALAGLSISEDSVRSGEDGLFPGDWSLSLLVGVGMRVLIALALGDDGDTVRS